MKELQGKRPAEVVQSTYSAPSECRALLTGRREDVLRELRRRQVHGEVHSAGQLRLLTTGPQAGEYAIPIVLIPGRRPSRRHRLALWLGAGLVTLSALCGAGLWLTTAMSRFAAMTFLGALLVAFVSWVAVGLGRKPRVSVTTTTTTQVVVK